MTTEKDELHRFIFDNLPVRGERVQLQSSWKEVLERHDYPAVIRDVLGEAMAATVLLSATIKFLGSITLQVQSTGPVSMLVVQVKTDKTLRAIASYDEDVDIQPGLKNLFGEAQLVITIEMENASDRYQGIVALGETTIAAALEEYFRSSEQLETRLWLTADEDVAAGYLLQQMPGERSADGENEDWNRLLLLTQTLTDDELKTLPVKTLLERLYSEDDVRLFAADKVEFACDCSKEKIEKTLLTLGREEVVSILKEQGEVGVDCNFCNQHYSFDSIDIETMFAKGPRIHMPETRH